MQESLLHRRIDLHFHSVHSDGVLTPVELIALAKENNLEMLALTDHDTLNGLEEARKVALENNIKLINGVEISVQWEGIPLHVVALNFAQGNSVLHDIVTGNQQIRQERGKQIALLLQKRNLPDLYDKVLEEAGPSQIGRPHFAKVLVNEGIVKNMNKAFDQYLSNKHMGKLKSIWPDMDQVIPALAETNCEIILAHPRRYPMTLTKLKRVIEAFVEMGGNGMEVASGNEKPQDVRLLENLAVEFDLNASVGSDFHGPTSSWSQLGKYTSIDELKVKPIWHKWL